MQLSDNAEYYRKPKRRLAKQVEYFCSKQIQKKADDQLSNSQVRESSHAVDKPKKSGHTSGSDMIFNDHLARAACQTKNTCREVGLFFFFFPLNYQPIGRSIQPRRPLSPEGSAACAFQMRSPARARPPEPARRAKGRRGTTVRCGQRRRAWSKNALCLYQQRRRPASAPRRQRASYAGGGRRAFPGCSSC